MREKERETAGEERGEAQCLEDLLCAPGVLSLENFNGNKLCVLAALLSVS